MGSSIHDGFDDRKAEYNSEYTIDDGKNFTWYNIYMKPLSTTLGVFGFGYTYFENFDNISIREGILADKQNSTNSGALHIIDTGGAFTYIRHNYKTDTITFTWTKNTKGNWTDGLGFIYKYQTSNAMIKVDKELNKLVFNPDTTSQAFSFGITKTLDEIQNGFSFKTATVGFRKSESKYYDYDLNSNKTYSDTGELLSLEIIYMFKPKNDKQIYTSFFTEHNQEKLMNTNIFLLEFGLLF